MFGANCGPRPTGDGPEQKVSRQRQPKLFSAWDSESDRGCKMISFRHSDQSPIRAVHSMLVKDSTMYSYESCATSMDTSEYFSAQASHGEGAIDDMVMGPIL